MSGQVGRVLDAGQSVAEQTVAAADCAVRAGQAADVGSAAGLHSGATAHAAAIGRLFQDYNRSLVSYLAVRLQSVQEAKEVAQEAYVRMLQLEKLGAESFLKAYLFRIASNIAIDRLRWRTRQTRFKRSLTPDILDSGLNQPEALLLADEELQVLTGCLTELPPKCREAFLLFRMDGQSQEAIAAHLGVTDRMVRHYINQAVLYCRLRIDGLSASEARDRLKQ